jgi:hypothetical protein
MGWLIWALVALFAIGVAIWWMWMQQRSRRHPPRHPQQRSRRRPRQRRHR